VTPDDPIVRTFLSHSMVARIATLSAKGIPALTPLWFVVAGGRMITTTGATTLAARNAAANPEVAVLLDAEALGRSAHVLRLLGRATVNAGLPPWPVIARVVAKYELAPASLRLSLAHRHRWPLRRRLYGSTQSAWIEIVPEQAELLRRPE
jgi:hypothetical protein